MLSIKSTKFVLNYFFFDHCPSSYIRRIVLYLVLLYLSKTADWQSKARVKINFTIRERFQKLIMNPGRASSIFNTEIYFTYSLLDCFILAS